MSDTVICTGYQFVNKHGGNCKVTKYVNYGEIHILFENGYQTIVQGAQIKKANIRNPLVVSAYGVGYLGEDICTGRNYPEVRRIYTIWHSMLQRCYSSTCHIKYPAYSGCTVSEDWFCFAKFLDWYRSQTYQGEDAHIDKDLLVAGNRVYSESTCCLIPREINQAMSKPSKLKGVYPTGVSKRGDTYYVAECSVGKGDQRYLGCMPTPIQAFYLYKDFKESLYRELAEKYKEAVPIQVYQALYNRKVEED